MLLLINTHAEWERRRSTRFALLIALAFSLACWAVVICVVVKVWGAM